MKPPASTQSLLPTVYARDAIGELRTTEEIDAIYIDDWASCGSEPTGCQMTERRDDYTCQQVVELRDARTLQKRNLDWRFD